MKIIEMYKAKRPLLSLEIFPPRSDYPLDTIFKTLDKLKLINPAYISVTYGAGGSNKDRTVDIATRIKKDYLIESQAHLTCVSHTRAEVKAILDELTEQGIENIMALRGDLPEDCLDFDIEKQEYRYAFQLVEEIKNRGNFGIGAAAHMEGHPECSTLQQDLLNLKYKVDLGVDFLITQLFFDNRVYYEFLDKCRRIGINCPIIPGIMPVLNARQIRHIIYLCGASMPAKMLILVDKYENRPDDMEKAGIEYASQQVNDLLQSGVPGVHLYTMNKPDQITTIVRNTGLI
ncbi:MAG TPA: methylenetetrahydrofolate reductase [NAD(P)H] [Syntrophomonadaceae bacterium]|nr:methylenetetrahydrofolate reductase [NAD(P)H] [Syntrophomonadaceae bacterium]